MTFPNRWRAFTLVSLCLLAPTAPVHAASATDTLIVIDWAKSYNQATTASCGSIAFKNMEDEKTYTLWIKGTSAASCSFHADGLTFHYPSNYGPTTQGATTLFSFVRFGPDVLVAWTPGY
jgi:hypothetical protein